jgi:cell division protein FtsB
MLTDSEALLLINGILLGITAWFLKVGIDVVRRALDTIQNMQIHQAAQTEVLKSHTDAIARHERAIEKLLNE